MICLLGVGISGCVWVDVFGEDWWSVMGIVYLLGYFLLNMSIYLLYVEYISLVLDILIYYIVKFR